MPRCCGGASCSCAIEGGSHIEVAGVGSATDPFVIVGDVDLEVVDNASFNLTLAGLGTLVSPWQLSVAYAATAKLADLPDVSETAPTNGQVLAFNTATGLWGPVAPTTAASGAVLHDTSLAGDGSAGTPLQVQEDPAAGLTTRPAGLGLADSAINQLVRKFPTVAARTAATPVPTLNTLSLVDSEPGEIDYWDGDSWEPAGGAFLLGDVAGQEFYQLSGAYAGGRLAIITRNILTTTDATGAFVVLAATELAGRAGVMSVNTQIIYGVAPVPIVVEVEGVGGAIIGHAFRVDDGTVYALGTVGLMVHAFVY